MLSAQQLGMMPIACIPAKRVTDYKSTPLNNPVLVTNMENGISNSTSNDKLFDGSLVYHYREKHGPYSMKHLLTYWHIIHRPSMYAVYFIFNHGCSNISCPFLLSNYLCSLCHQSLRCLYSLRTSHVLSNDHHRP